MNGAISSAETVPTSLENQMAAALELMPWIRDLPTEVVDEIIKRCARVAVEFGALVNGTIDS